jgi:DNA-binding FadR family transcriptional regulator
MPMPVRLPGAAAGARPRSLAAALVGTLAERIRRARWAPGHRLPTEAALMAECGVSRTVVREALSRLQAQGLVETRHGVGTFVAAAVPPAAFPRIAPQRLATLHDVVALLELRIAVETEAAGLAAQRRTEADLRAMRRALAQFLAALGAGQDAVQADFALHHEIARATRNDHFADLLASLGERAIPRARLGPPGAADPGAQAYLRRVHAEHLDIVDAIAARDADAARAAMRLHLGNSRERRRRAAAAEAQQRPALARMYDD